MAEIKNAAMLQNAITEDIQDFLKAEQEKSIQKAVDAFEVDLREAVGKAAVRMANTVDFMSMTDRLRIEVRLTK